MKDLAAIVEDALELPEAQREGFLRQACAGDEELLSSVRLILAARSAAGQFRPTLARRAGAEAAARAGEFDPDEEFQTALPQPPAGGPEALDSAQPGEDDAAALDEATLIEAPGARIGPYTLLRVLGEGGFGRVFLADQERPVRRKVALKVIRLGMDTRSVIARFAAERQALAIMDHPGIARVFDAGSTRTGRPYFVMELVEGVPITRFCDAMKLDLRRRIELFREVCAAVQHAHRKGVIHRDLKPSNILVTEQDGRAAPKVIDFGIAKATHAQLTDRTIETARHMFIGTPQYMSPEQADLSREDADIDTRSDVFALGVILYELLTGTTPLGDGRLDRLDLAQMQRLIREEPVQRPSSRLTGAGERQQQVAAERRESPDRLRRLIRGDLDWIVLKALEKERDRRYESPSALSADLQRYLTNQPVEARPASAVYRLRKFAQRHRGPVIAASAVLAALILGLVGTTSFAIIAALGARHSREVDGFLTGLFGATNPLSAATPAMEPGQVRQEAGRLFSRDIGIANQVLLSYAAKLGAIGQPLRAATLLQESLSRSDGVRGTQDEPAARMQLALLLSSLGRHEEALEQGRQAIDLMKAAGLAPWQLGQALRRLGGILNAAQRPEAAFHTLREAAETMEADPGGGSSSGFDDHLAPIERSRPTTESIAARSEAAALLEAGLPDSPTLSTADRLTFLRASAELAEAGSSGGLDQLRIERALARILHQLRAREPSTELEVHAARFVRLSNDLYREEPQSRLEVMLMAIRWLRDAGAMDAATAMLPEALAVAETLPPDEPLREQAQSLAVSIHFLIAGRTSDPSTLAEAEVAAVELLARSRDLLRLSLGPGHARSIEAGLAYAEALRVRLAVPRMEEALRELDRLLGDIGSPPDPTVKRQWLSILASRAAVLGALCGDDPAPARELIDEADRAHRSLIAARREEVSRIEAIRDTVVYARWCRSLGLLEAARDQLEQAIRDGLDAGPDITREVDLLECIKALVQIESRADGLDEEGRAAAAAGARRLARSLLARDGQQSTLGELRQSLEFLLGIGAVQDAEAMIAEIQERQAGSGSSLPPGAVESLAARVLAHQGRCEDARVVLDTVLTERGGTESKKSLGYLLVKMEQVRMLASCPLDPGSADQLRADFASTLRALSGSAPDAALRDLLLEGWITLESPP